MLLRTSRYADPTTTNDIMLVDQNGNQVRTLFRRPNWSGTFDFVYYVWREGDRIDRIAQRFLGDPTMYWKIMDLNPEILNPGQIAPGTNVRIPSA